HQSFTNVSEVVIHGCGVGTCIYGDAPNPLALFLVRELVQVPPIVKIGLRAEDARQFAQSRIGDQTHPMAEAVPYPRELGCRL
ncbi:MAG: hypothetical protein ABSA58_22055, partial [Acetobacteraceae bacterium]